MAIGSANTAALQRWIGREATSANSEDLEAAIVRLGDPYSAALEFLLAERADMALGPAEVGNGSTRVRFDPDRLDSLIDQLGTWLATQTDITLSTTAAQIVAGVDVAAASATVEVTATATRRG